MQKKFLIILFLLLILQCILSFVPPIDNETLSEPKKSEREVSIPVPQENPSDETEHIYCPSGDNADDITNTDHEWIYLN